MLSLEQIRSLENKVTKAVKLLETYREENRLLKSRLSQYEARIEELEFMIEEFKEDQSEIEQGIISALNHLDSLEDAVGGLKQGVIAETKESPKAEENGLNTSAATEEFSAQEIQKEAQVTEQPEVETSEADTETEAFTEAYEEEASESDDSEDEQQLDIF